MIRLTDCPAWLPGTLWHMGQSWGLMGRIMHLHCNALHLQGRPENGTVSPGSPLYTDRYMTLAGMTSRI